MNKSFINHSQNVSKPFTRSREGDFSGQVVMNSNFSPFTSLSGPRSLRLDELYSDDHTFHNQHCLSGYRGRLSTAKYQYTIVNVIWVLRLKTLSVGCWQDG